MGGFFFFAFPPGHVERCVNISSIAFCVFGAVALIPYRVLRSSMQSFLGRRGGVGERVKVFVCDRGVMELELHSEITRKLTRSMFLVDCRRN